MSEEKKSPEDIYGAEYGMSFTGMAMAQSLASMAEAPPPDMVKYPPHYTGHPSGVEAIDVREGMICPLADAFKYLFRRDAKGAPVDDLRKASWYLRHYLRMRQDAPLPAVDMVDASRDQDDFWACPHATVFIPTMKRVVDAERGNVRWAMGAIFLANDRRSSPDQTKKFAMQALAFIEAEIATRTSEAA